MKEINVLEGKVVAPEGMKVAIVASRFNEIIVNKLLQTKECMDDIFCEDISRSCFCAKDTCNSMCRLMTGFNL